MASIIAAYDLDTRQFDAENAYLNTKLDECVICEFPPGFERPGYVLELLRAIYGQYNRNTKNV